LGLFRKPDVLEKLTSDSAAQNI